MSNLSFEKNTESEITRESPDIEPNLPTAQKIRSLFQNLDPTEQIMAPNLEPTNLTKSSSIITSKTAFDTLELTDISQLRLKMSNTGKYVLVRCIEKGLTGNLWLTAVEDHLGNVCLFSVSNYPPQELFFPGTVLIVKEPYFDTRDNYVYGISCYCPTDLLVLRPSHPLFHLSKRVHWINELKGPAIDPLMILPLPFTALKWKERGNTFFNKNYLILAREAYFLGLELCKDSRDVNTEKTLKLNILACHLQLEYYEKAIELAIEILEKFPNEKKALFRLGKAYYAARKFQDAFQIFEKLCQTFPKDKEGKEEFRCVQERIKEQNGEFDVEKLRQLAKLNPLKEIDCADYERLIEIKEIAGKGRGLVLKKDVKKDSVVMISKALASTLNPIQDESSVYFPGHEDDPEVRERDGAKVVLKAIHMISKNPSLFGPLVFNLYSGPTSTLQGQPYQPFFNPELKEEPICDVEKLKLIHDHNDFRIVNWRNGGGKGTGLFILPSYMNHSCELNVDYKFYNDVMVCTAMDDLKEGTELTTSYVNESWDYELRTMMLNARGFKCDCNKCKRRI